MQSIDNQKSDPSISNIIVFPSNKENSLVSEDIQFQTKDILNDRTKHQNTNFLQSYTFIKYVEELHNISSRVLLQSFNNYRNEKELSISIRDSSNIVISKAKPEGPVIVEEKSPISSYTLLNQELNKNITDAVEDSADHGGYIVDCELSYFLDSSELQPRKGTFTEHTFCDKKRYFADLKTAKPSEWNGKDVSWREVDFVTLDLPLSSEFVQGRLDNCYLICAAISLTALFERKSNSLIKEVITPWDLNDCFSAGMRYFEDGTMQSVKFRLEAPYNKGKSMLSHSIADGKTAFVGMLELGYLASVGYKKVSSNPALETFRLSGWFPELLNIKETFNLGTFWFKLKSNFQEGAVLAALAIKNREQEAKKVGLRNNHCYAVIGFLKVGNEDLVKLSDPTGKTACLINEATRLKKVVGPGELILPAASIIDHFDHLYLNWNPANYPFKKQIRVQMKMKQRNIGDLSVFPQFLLKIGANSPKFETRIMLEKSGNQPGIGYKLFDFEGHPVVYNDTPLKSSGIRRYSVFSDNFCFENSEEDQCFTLVLTSPMPNEDCEVVITV